MNNRHFPVELITPVFSFFNGKGYYDFSPLQLVCKDWYKIANQEMLWKQLIRSEYHSAFAESKLSAKQFYTNNIDARIDTYYCIGSMIGISLDWSDRIEPIDKKSLFAAFPDSGTIKIFYSREQAMKCVEGLSDFHYQHYHPLFTIRVNPNVLKKSFFDKTITFDPDEKEECFEIEVSEVMNHYSVYYEARAYGKNNHADTIVITQSHLKHEKKEEEKKDENCLIQ